jgi:hypothetical protein
MMLTRFLPTTLVGEVFALAGLQSYARVAMASKDTKMFLDSVKLVVSKCIRKLVTTLSEGIIEAIIQHPNIEELELHPFRMRVRSGALAMLPPTIHTLIIVSQVYSISVGLLSNLLNAAPATCGVVRVKAEIGQQHVPFFFQATPARSGQVYVSFDVSTIWKWKPMILMQLINCIPDAGHDARCALLTVRGYIGRSRQRWALMLDIVSWKLAKSSCTVVDVHFVTQGFWAPPRFWLRSVATQMRQRAAGVTSFVLRVNDDIY